MKLKIIAATAFAAACFAQPGPGGPGFGGGMQQPPTTDIKAYLQLTDSQIQSMTQINQQFFTSTQSLRQEMAQKRTSLRDQIEKGSTDAAALGRILLDIEALRKRVEQADTAARAQARAVLNAAQQAKLKSLEDAVALREEIQQATMLHLLAHPEPQAGAGAGFGPRGGAGGPGPRFGFGPRQ